MPTMTSSTLKALLVAFATLSSAAPASEALHSRELVLTGGAYCCTWEGCAHCEYGACVLNISTAEGYCPFKSGTMSGPIPAGNKCCQGVNCQPCDWGVCLVTSIIGHEGTCPFYHSEDPGDQKVLDPGAACTLENKCRFGQCTLIPGAFYGRCPTEGMTKDPLGPGEKCCTAASCAPCEAPYYCEMLAKPNFNNFPPGTCQFN